MGRIPGPNGDIRRMHGEIDEVTVYNRALLPDEIVAIFRAGNGRQMQTLGKEAFRSICNPQKAARQAAF